MTFHQRLLILTVAALALAPSSWAMGNRPKWMHSARDKSVHITDTRQYIQVLHGLLDQNWALDHGPIRVWHKADPEAPATPDLREVQERVISDAQALDPAEVGLYEGASLFGIHAGPFLTESEGTTYAYVLTIDSRTWGDKHERCFALYKDLQQISNSNVRTQIAEADCKWLWEIKKTAPTPLPQGFSPLTIEGRQILTSLSNREWGNKVVVPNPWYPDEKIQFRESFKFEFWNHESMLNYTSAFHGPMGAVHQSGPFNDGIMPEVRQLGMRTIRPGVTQFFIWADQTSFYSQTAAMMTFIRGEPKLWDAKTYEEIESAESTRPGYYCYEGFDCSWHKKYSPGSPSLKKEIDANFIVLQYDEAKPDLLEVHYEMMDPRNPSARTVFRAQ